MVPRSHFMHQGHALVQIFNTREYLCGGCKTDGCGTNFGCESCSFHMHDFCSNCPRILSSFLHPQHPLLSLMISNTQYTASPRICDVCEDTVEGIFYWCQTCDFSVHPICTRFPKSLSHAVHSPHLLTFQKSYKDALCCICGGVCNSWRYRCGYCDGFDVHVDCIARSYDEKSCETTSRRLPPWAGLYTYGGVSCTDNSYNNNNPPCGANGVPSSVNTCGMYNYYGVVPHGTYAYQPINPNGEMPIGTSQNGIPHCMHHPHNGAPFDPNSQHLQNHHDNTSHQFPGHYAQTSTAQGQGSGKLGGKIFRIVATILFNVTLNVMTGGISGAIF